MDFATLELPGGHCVEVCQGDKLIGYAIFFSGGWDAWSIITPHHRSAIKMAARALVTNTSRERAIEAIQKDHQ